MISLDLKFHNNKHLLGLNYIEAKNTFMNNVLFP